MYFEDLYTRLIEIARQRISSGQISERGLARLCDISQPHLHNVLKNIRSLSPDSADRLMRGMKITVPSLMWRDHGENESGVSAVPVLRNRIGPGSEAVFGVYRGFFPLPDSLLTRLVDPMLARLAADLVLPALVRRNDLVLLDQNPAVRETPDGRGCWVVAEAAGLRVRYAKRGDHSIALASEATVHDPEAWQTVPLLGRNILEIVLARIVWVSREMESGLAL